jgi:hypothetical protein
MSKADAYREAGFTGTNRSSVWRACEHAGPLVTELREKVERAWAKSQVVKREEVVESLRETRRRAKALEPEKRHRKGCEDPEGCECPLVVPKPDLAAANKADELLGKTIGLFVDVSREEDIEQVLDGMSDAEIDCFMRENLQKFDPNYLRTLISKRGEEAASSDEVPPPDKLN